MINLHHGDCLEVLRTMADNSVDAVVTDPPYGLSFMGKKWDYDVPSVEVWAECLRVLKPGGHLLAFAGTRTQHRMAVRIEDAGFEIRDMIAWVYGSGFPKSLDVSKAIDKAAGAERDVVGQYQVTRDMGGGSWAELHGKPNCAKQHNITAPATDAARQWQGWGTALKPALEPITVARKPLDGTVAENVLEHGTGALNIDRCRVESGAEDLTRPADALGSRFANFNTESGAGKCIGTSGSTNGRWPANLIHDGSDEVVGRFPAAPGQQRATTGEEQRGPTNVYGKYAGVVAMEPRDNGGSAARFFYCAKASKEDRGEGNAHPTVKPTDLMRYLCRLVTPPGGTVLDPFTGSGSTGRGAVLEGFDFIGIEREAEYIPIARARIEAAQLQYQPTLFDL